MPPTLKLSHSSLVGDGPSSYSVRSLGTGLFFHDEVEFVEAPPQHNDGESLSYSPDCAAVTTSTRDDTVKKEPYLGGEPSSKLLGQAVERQGVASILEALSEEERAAMPDDGMPIRHLRAENGNVHKAIEKLKAALRWRQEFGVDRIVHANNNKAVGDNNNNNDEEMQSILKQENATGKIYVRGYDAQGRALMHMFPGRENTKHETNNMRHLVWNLEKAIACTARKSVELQEQSMQQQQQQANTTPAAPVLPLPLEKINLIIDYDGFHFRDAPPMSTSKYTLDILQKHYPERMHRAYVLNAPRAFSIFWTLIKPFVDPATKQRIVFCNNTNTDSKANTKMPLVEAVGKHNLDKLEPCAGGTATKEFDSTEYLRLPFAQSFDE